MESSQITEDTKLVKASPKDFFLHLLSMVALYVSAGSFITLLFQYINSTFPDVVIDGYYMRESLSMSVRWSVSLLIVAFPIYLLVNRSLEKSYTIDAYKRNVRIKKWLTYFTLFVSALMIAGDLVTLINTFLGGELTIRFALKVLVIFFVAGSIFWYYFSQTKKYKGEA